MSTQTKKTRRAGADFFERAWKDSWTYIKTVVDVLREPVLILDKDFRVMAANEPFYRMFHVEPVETEGKVVYQLGNGQWDISALRKLLEDILPKHTFFKGFEVAHEFPVIGHKIVMLNARQIHAKFTDKDGIAQPFPPIILLAMEDVTEIMSVAETLARHTNQFEKKTMEKTSVLEKHILSFKKELGELKKKL